MTPRQGLRDILELFRPGQWPKNLLVALPLLASQSFAPVTLGRAALVFAAMCLLASAVYAANDVADRASDAAHPRKRARPVASGRVAPRRALLAAAAAAAAGLALAATLGFATLVVCAGYLLVAASYVAGLKRLPLVDLGVLSLLHVLRIVAGGTATAILPSVWLLGFATFFFLSLAAVKRQGELAAFPPAGGAALAGRGYRAADLPRVSAIAAVAGIVAALVLAAYVAAPEARLVYADPRPLWAVCLIVPGWIGRMILLAQRGKLADDPLAFALRDPVSLGSLAAITALVWRAS